MSFTSSRAVSSLIKGLLSLLQRLFDIISGTLQLIVRSRVSTVLLSAFHLIPILTSLTSFLSHFELRITYSLNLIDNVSKLPLLLVKEASFVTASLAILKHLVLLHTLTALFIRLEQVECLLGDLIVDAIDFARPRLLMMRQVDAKDADA